MTVKKVPMRKCLGCGEMLPRKELVRVVRTRLPVTEGEEEKYEITLDLTGKKNGRGAYVCKNSECLIKARKAGRIERALTCRIPDEIFSLMEQEMKDNE